jgi:hypothetical protein
MRFGEREPSSAEPVATSRPRIIIPPPPEGPKALPIERAAPSGWNSFGHETTEPATVDSPAAAEAPQAEGESAAAVVLRTEHPTEAASASAAEAATEGVPEDVLPDARATTDGVPVTHRRDPESPPDFASPAGKAGYCRECGSPFQPDHAFCTTCGAKLN